MTERNRHFENGITQALNTYLEPAVPWEGKSNLDMLKKMNEMRKGDLSVFLSLLEASSDLKDSLQFQDGNIAATTFFVQTNTALAMLDIGPLYANNETLKLFVQNT